MIVISDEFIEQIENKIKLILLNNSINNIKSFKWNKFNNDDKVNAFKDIINFISPFLLDNSMYINVLIWDVEDSRHSVFPRNDVKNLEMMYHKIIKNFANNYLDNDDFLFVHPDRQNSINWNLIEEILEKQGFYNLEYGRNIYIEESSTEKAFLIQLADIFAGIGRTSYLNYDEYSIRGDINQSVLVNFKEELSGKTKKRFKVIKFLHDWSKRNKLQISINENKGFKSHKKGPLNFWLYEPQHELDKAPIKQKK